MRRYRSAIVLGLVIIFAAACRARQPEPEYRPSTTIKDIMDSIVDPSADTLWESVKTVVTTAGVEEMAPQTDEDWKNVRRSAVRLVEATNLLLIPGRHVARPGEKSENPGIELGPEEIQHRIDADRSAWMALAHGLHDAALPAINAIEAKDASRLFEAGAQIDAACESCHRKYWYPEDVASSIESRLKEQ